MGDGIPFGDLIILGAVALFIILRYRSVLGEKSGHDFSKNKQDKPESEAEKVVHISGKTMTQTELEAQDEKTLADIDDPEMSQAIAKMKTTDANFSIQEFLAGAKMAFEMVIKAFNERDYDTLKMLLAEDVYESFESELKAQEKKGHQAITTLVSLEGAEITEAELKRSKANITVQFTSEQINIVKDKDSKVVEGDASDIDNIVDEWTFERDLKSRNPNWTIVAT